ncbi:aminotransferase class I/II-fold pyridoxal phosphate-dependent enzyme [Exiguobacterium acetylicum]|uniref:aminotransferase class I/II-fold pyridoxal phosphate-dependent enzyme n=1 Tax=Exiguobacterium acetylicum TaxID=41170 RepID=UPI0027E07FBD|nr:aminotransferase class I/II-fold pyridoxal phosphate-dependent enzyme [Exiguobacterium acetylicum]MDQ6467811.1 aminotransferase class I/II-fold pyridoxal phosphate-dependent enzyme [Exiguobacterium acetylicum]
MKHIPLSIPHLSGQEARYVTEALETNWVAPLGPNVDAFERDMQAYTGAGATLATSSGTAAIHLALATLGVTTGDDVFCQSLTFIASTNPIRYVGARPVLIDSEEETWNMSPVALRRALIQAATRGRLPKAVIVVHLYGVAAQIEEIAAICEEYDVPLIEDAAESLGTRVNGRMTGTFGTFGIYSFNGNKIITTSGGGMLVANDPALIERAFYLGTQARQPVLHYEHMEVGYNYRMSNVAAGIGRGQLEVLDQRVDARRKIFDRYDRAFAPDSVTSQVEQPRTFANRWLSAFLLPGGQAQRDAMIQTLQQANAESRPVWKPMHLQPVYRDVPFVTAEGVDVSRRLFEDGICLPSASQMTFTEQAVVIRNVRHALQTTVRRNVQS